jgi:hypothetical protein
MTFASCSCQIILTEKCSIRTFRNARKIFNDASKGHFTYLMGWSGMNEAFKNILKATIKAEVSTKKGKFLRKNLGNNCLYGGQVGAESLKGKAWMIWNGSAWTERVAYR